MYGRVKSLRVVLQSICALTFLVAPCEASPAAPRTRDQIEADILVDCCRAGLLMEFEAA